MSDGERVIFYLLGHCLLADADSVVIVDEPELHIHKAILPSLWDAIEGERPDCSFAFITHDLDFLTARPTADKFVVTSFENAKWTIEKLPADSGLPERIISELVGSRQPILFVEGERGSLDLTIYRDAYPGYLVQAVGGCDVVIHSVTTFRNNNDLHHFGLVCGCVDSDHRSESEIASLKDRGVVVLPAAEVENILAMPEVFTELAKNMSFDGAETEKRLNALTADICEQANKDSEDVAVRYAVRRLDAEVKKMVPKAKTIDDLQKQFATEVQKMDIAKLASGFKEELNKAVSSKDLAGVLKLYDNKGILSLVAKHLGIKGGRELSEWVSRLLGGPSSKPLKEAIAKVVPQVEAA